MANYNSTARKKQARKTRDKIYAVAVRMMRKHGFDSVTIEDICKKAGVSVGSFYNHFTSKTDVFNEIFNQIDEHFEKDVAPNLPETGAREQILQIFRAYSRFNIEHGEDFVRQLYNTKSKNFIKTDRFLPQLLQKTLACGQENGEIIAAMTAGEISASLFTFVRGIVFDWCLHDGGYDLTEAVDRHLTRYLTVFLTGTSQHS